MPARAKAVDKSAVGEPMPRTAALMRWIHSARNVRFFFCACGRDRRIVHRLLDRLLAMRIVFLRRP